MPIYSLVDGNSFYCSCERAFNPRLKGKPVVVLSNNDGCVIARTPEAKALGIRMGEPWHEVRKRPECRSVKWFSSNYALYADMSRRVFDVLETFSPHVEPYSIDEMFMSLDGIIGDLREYGRRIRETVLKATKIPTCVGIGPTKTIAKLANKYAKDAAELGGVCDLREEGDRLDLFARWPVGEVWGIGPASAKRLERHGVRTVLDFIRMDARHVRDEFSVVGARIQEELKGNSCLPLSMVAPMRKGLAVTRSFGSPVTEWRGMEEAIATFAYRAGEKLREHGLVAGHLTVFMRTSEFRPGPKYGNQAAFTIEPTSDGLTLVKLATRAARRLWRDGYTYAKGGVMLNDLSPPGARTEDLFPSKDPVKSSKLMATLDELNARFGRGAVRSGATGIERRWTVRTGNLSPRYTTSFEDALVVRT